MKFRNQFLKYKLNCQTSPDAGEGNGGGAGEGDANKGDENNGENNLPSFDNMWENPTDEGGDSSASPQQITVVNQEAPASAEAVFDEHVAGIDFTSGIDVANLQTAMQSGDAEGFGKAIRSIGESAYRQAMIDTNKIINQRVDKAKAEMATASQTATATERAVMQLNDALPYTKMPMYKPVADAAFTRFLQQKDMTVDKAIQKTGEYFTKFSGDVAKASPKSPNARPAGGFGVIDETPAGDDDQDWMSFLGNS